MRLTQITFSYYIVQKPAEELKTQQSTLLPKPISAAYAWYALGLLFVVYVLNFVDRVIVVSLFPSLTKEFQFNATQNLLIGTTAFVIFYTALGVPFGRLADKVSRKALIAGGLLLWSLASGMSGFAQNFWQLFACRLLVGVGEATLGPAALSLLSDYFPSKQRGLVQSIFASAIAVGSGLAFLAGTRIDAALGWRWAFYLVGFPGMLVAILVIALKEPERGKTESADVLATEPVDWRELLRKRVLLAHNFGYAFYAIAAASLTFIVPSYLVSELGLNKLVVGDRITLFVVIGGTLGILLGGKLADVWKAKRPGGRLYFTSLLAVISIPLWIGFLFVEDVEIKWLLYALLISLSLVWLGPSAADVHDIAGPRLRGVGIGFYYLVVNLLNYGIAQSLIYGRTIDYLKGSLQPHPYKTALYISIAAMVISACLLFWAGRLRESRKN